MRVNGVAVVLILLIFFFCMWRKLKKVDPESSEREQTIGVLERHFSNYSQDGKRVTLQEFSRFLKEEQGIEEKMENVACIMRDFLQDSSRAVAQPYFHVTEFMDYLFSNSNQILSPITRTVYHDMTRPLSHYFIASSHNTYLTGDQFFSESSTEAYARCLRMGCRSVELDCWDGKDGSPDIYHGHTFTSKIKFLDVIKTIKEHAFVTSDYPVILSIEDHCSLPQQRKMASAFIEVFGDSLVTAPIDKNEVELPSPEKMRRRIILKHKKLPEGADENTVIQLDNDPTRNMDLSDSIKTGILSMQETGDDEWRPRFFVLTSRTLAYSEVPGEADEEEALDHAEVDRRISTSTTCCSGYMDPNSFTSQLCARAMYDYKATRDNELSFSRGALITNVNQQDTGWWRGDHGGRRQHLFPANFTQIEEPEGDNTPLGNLQKGSVEIAGVTVEEEGCIIKVESKGVGGGVMELRAGTREEAAEWADKVRETGRDASDRDVESRRKEQDLGIARELSNLVIYCRTVDYNAEKAARKEAGGSHMEMSSFSETRAEKIFTENPEVLLRYHRTQISRVYPKWLRMASDNYSPLPMWAVGSQMIALNYQTGDRPMQLNQAKFIDNGSCGYLLRPQFMFNDNYNPCDKASALAVGIKPLSLEVRVMAARHLLRPGRGLVSPYVEVEVCGAEYDNVKFKTGTINDNGFNPVWNEVFQLNVANPDMALLRFCVYDEKLCGDQNFLGAATFPIKSLQTGFRSIQLKNNYGEELELSTLLVQLRDLTQAEVETRVLNVCKAFDKIIKDHVTLTSHFINDLGLDSLDHVEVVMAIEDEFGFEIPDDQAEKLLTPEHIVKVVLEHEQ